MPDAVWRIEAAGIDGGSFMAEQDERVIMREFYYELFFDGDEVNEEWGTTGTVLDGETYELCEQPYYVRADEQMLDALDLDPDLGVQDNDEMEAVLEQYHAPITGVADADLVNCVFDETRECLFGFHEIDEGEYFSHVGE